MRSLLSSVQFRLPQLTRFYVKHQAARRTFRWISAHTGLRVWVIGTSRWTFILLKDETQHTLLTAREAVNAVAKGP